MVLPWRRMATDGDGNTIRISSFLYCYDDAHKEAVLAFCRSMEWTGRLQGGHILKNGRGSGMVWVWEDDTYVAVAKDTRMKVWLKREGRAWRFLDWVKQDCVYPYLKTKREAMRLLKSNADHWRYMGILN
jgi:hypothetical protein